MEKRFINKEMDLVIAKECVENLIKGYIAGVGVYIADNNIDLMDKTQNAVQCREKLMVLLRKIGKANDIDELNNIAGEADKLERF